MHGKCRNRPPCPLWGALRFGSSSCTNCLQLWPLCGREGGRISVLIQKVPPPHQVPVLSPDTSACQCTGPSPHAHLCLGSSGGCLGGGSQEGHCQVGWLGSGTRGLDRVRNILKQSTLAPAPPKTLWNQCEEGGTESGELEGSLLPR